ncbi:MAG: CcmD family protein [Armatimonadota bacterium]|nr:CcmD family protein [Armatimonadota bacterium]
MNPLLVYMITPLLVWAGIFGYLFWLDMRLRIMEQRLSEETER